jgi:hypothetical protein
VWVNALELIEKAISDINEYATLRAITLHFNHPDLPSPVVG